MHANDSATVLVPVDFSKHSRAAALRACEFALACDATVRLLHALDLPTIVRERSIPSDSIDALRRSETRALDAWCRELAHRGASIHGVLEERDPVEMVAEHAAEKDVELVVIGTHGFRGGRERIFVGSVAERTIRTVGSPVMVVKESEWDAAVKVRRILLATDFSAAAEEALRLAIHWARRLGADVEVVHAIEKKSTEEELRARTDAGERDVLGVGRDGALDGLQSILARISAAGVPAGADLSYGPASIEIAKRAARSQANLVIMGWQGRSQARPVPRVGSVAERVLRHVKCSVLLVPSGGVSGASGVNAELQAF